MKPRYYRDVRASKQERALWILAYLPEVVQRAPHGGFDPIDLPSERVPRAPKEAAGYSALGWRCSLSVERVVTRGAISRMIFDLREISVTDYGRTDGEKDYETREILSWERGGGSGGGGFERVESQEHSGTGATWRSGRPRVTRGAST